MGTFTSTIFKIKKSDWSLSVGLPHGLDLDLLFLEGGLRGQIQDHFSISVFPRTLLIPEVQKKME